MLYRFKDFEFDSASLVLTQQGEALPIRHNEAKVLALLLERADKVLSKEDILSLVWQDKVVSDQAVFQNISHLRNLFGSDSIKTFSKRGYQWQLEFEVVSEDAIATNDPGPRLAQSGSTAHPKKRPNRLLVAVAGLAVVVSIIFSLQDNTTPNQASAPFEIAYIPFTNLTDKTTIQLQDSAHINFTELNQLTTRRFQTSAELEYRSLSNTHPFVLTAQIRHHKQQFHLDFLLKGPFAEWQGQLASQTTQGVITKLKQHLQQPTIYDLLSKPQSPELKQANLSIAHQQTPTDLIILGHLIDSYIHTDELDKAMVMADKLTNISQAQNSPQHHGNALLYQSEILTQKELFELSSQKLALAIERFEKIDDLKRQVDALEAQSWLDHQQKDYLAIKNGLLKAAHLALAAKDIPRELHMLTYLSVMAHKYREHDDKYLYLQQAEDKMREYQLPIYHYAKVPFHHAIYAESPSAKEPHLKQVLEYTQLIPDYWVAQSSRKQLMHYYIDENRLAEAKALAESVQPDNAENTFLKTLLAKAEQNEQEFLSQAQRTFEQAQLAGEKRLSLDVALLLCEHPNAPINYDFYSQYIKENANKYWRRANETKLLALNL